MATEIDYKETRIRREGNSIAIEKALWRSGGYVTDVVILLTDDGGIKIDEGWVERERCDKKHYQEWRDYLRNDLGLGPLGELYHRRPPSFIPRERFGEYLADIISGEFKIRGIGKITIKYIKEALERVGD